MFKTKARLIEIKDTGFKRKRRQINLTAIILSFIAAISITIAPTAQAYSMKEIAEVMVSFINASASAAYNQVLFNGSSPFKAGGGADYNLNATDAAISAVSSQMKTISDQLSGTGIDLSDANLDPTTLGAYQSQVQSYFDKQELLERLQSGKTTDADQATIKDIVDNSEEAAEYREKKETAKLTEAINGYNPFGGSDKPLFDMVAIDTSPENPVYAVIIIIKFAALAVGMLYFGFKYAVEMYNLKSDPYNTMMEYVMKFTLLALLIIVSDKIAAAVIELAYAIVIIMMQALTNQADTAPAVTLANIVGKKKAAGKLTWMEGFGCIAVLIGPFIMSVGVRLYAWFTAFSIMLELGVRRALLPFGIIEFFADDFKSPAVRYIKKLMAAVLRLGIAALVCAIATYMTGMLAAPPADDADFFAIAARGILFCLASVVINFTAVVVIGRSGEFANDAMDV